MYGMVEGWSSKLLSRAGKEVLIKAVLQSISSYAMQCFRFPATVISELESIEANFWWDSTKEKRKAHWASWNRLCLTKQDGGMGFRHLKHFNSALLMKQAWRLVSEPERDLAKAYKAKYFPDTEFWDALLGSAPSYTWRSILHKKEMVRKGCKWRLGDGNSFPIWQDSWVPSTTWFRARKGENQTQPSSSRGPSRYWGDMWKWKIPPKIKHFLWRVMTDNLPTSSNMVKRGLQDLIEYDLGRFRREELRLWITCLWDI
ncbi:hypothetical protein LIER_30055 [Lithospermum erythrorhizon]|uniref:Reverse transcriptase zinc-binding domain-containing protein n=1 Tax=Lithospermum erythrorhizon TaxID=34254 RepID=A0AAV3RPX4_LITER